MTVYEELVKQSGAHAKNTKESADNTQREREEKQRIRDEEEKALQRDQNFAADISFEDLIAQSGGSSARAQQALRRIFGENTTAAAFAIEGLREYVDEQRAEERSQREPAPVQPASETIELHLRGPDGRQAVAYTGREGAEMLRQLAREQVVSLQ